MLVLLCLILRPVAIEFQSQRPIRWRTRDWPFLGASVGWRCCWHAIATS
jgi:cytochrome bd-type quinol oxidase subunit 2